MGNSSLFIGLEEFRPVPGASTYYVSAHGLVFSKRSNRLLKPALVGGYPYISVVMDGAAPGAKGASFYVHRLVALAWLPNPEGKYSVNHIDGDKANNCLSNLEWATQSEQIQHAMRTGLLKHKGSKRTDETKAKMAAAKIGAKHPLFKGYYHTPFGVFASSFEAAAAAGVAHQTVRKHCHSQHPNWADWYISPNPS